MKNIIFFFNAEVFRGGGIKREWLWDSMCNELTCDRNENET